jgi:hypothetical protein
LKTSKDAGSRRTLGALKTRGDLFVAELVDDPVADRCLLFDGQAGERFPHCWTEFARIEARGQLLDAAIVASECCHPEALAPCGLDATALVVLVHEMTRDAV